MFWLNRHAGQSCLSDWVPSTGSIAEIPRHSVFAPAVRSCARTGARPDRRPPAETRAIAASSRATSQVGPATARAAGCLCVDLPATTYRPEGTLAQRPSLPPPKTLGRGNSLSNLWVLNPTTRRSGSAFPPPSASAFPSRSSAWCCSIAWKAEAHRDLRPHLRSNLGEVIGERGLRGLACRRGRRWAVEISHRSLGGLRGYLCRLSVDAIGELTVSRPRSG